MVNRVQKGEFNINNNIIQLAKACGVSQEEVRDAYSKLNRMGISTDEECWALVETELRIMNSKAKF